MMPQRLHVLYEDNHLLALAKPTGLSTMGAERGQPTLLARAKKYLKHKYHKPGNVYLGVVSRLDAPTSGVVVLARTSKAAKRLTQQFRQHRVQKQYLALVSGTPDPPDMTLRHTLVKNELARKMMVVAPNTAGAQIAELSYNTLKRFVDTTLLLIELMTGRKHQIRVQLAACGHPVLGDRKYGSDRSFPEGIALHAWRLTLDHPVRGTRVQLEAPLPDSWRAYGFKWGKGNKKPPFSR